MTNRRPITHEDLFEIRMVSAPKISPDGRTVLYSVTHLDGEADQEYAALWLHELDTGASRQLTSGREKDGSPEWSPGNTWVAFTSGRSGTTQLWAMRVSGGEPVQLTDLAGGIEGHIWSPDGRMLAFTSRVGPDAPEENEPRRITSIRYRFDAIGYFNDQYQQLFVLDFDPSADTASAPRQITDGAYEHQQPAWSPTGQEIAFRTARFPDWELDVVSDIWTIRIDGSGPRKVTSTRNAWSSPSWTADGADILLLGPSNFTRAGYANTEVWTVPASGGEPVSLTSTLDRSIGDHIIGDVPRFQADRVIQDAVSGSVHFLASDYGNTHIFKWDPQNGITPAVTGEHRIGSFNLLPDGGYIFSASTPIEPGEIYRCDANGSNEQRITNVNRAWRDQVSLIEPEEIWVDSADDTAIQGWLLRPHGVSDPATVPMTVQLHGGPHIQYGNGFMHEFQLLAAQGYAVLYGNPRGSTGYGEAFTGELIGRWGEADQPDVMALIDGAIHRGGIDRDRIGVLGGSYGGILTNWLIGHSDRFKAAVTMRSCSNFYSMYGTDDISYNSNVLTFGVDLFDDPELYWRLSPITYVEQINTPTLILHSEEDYRCPIEQSEQLFTALKRLGRTTEFVRFPNESHGLSRSGSPKHRLERLHKITEWFGRWL